MRWQRDIERRLENIERRLEWMDDERWENNTEQKYKTDDVVMHDCWVKGINGEVTVVGVKGMNKSEGLNFTTRFWEYYVRLPGGAIMVVEENILKSFTPEDD